MNQGEEITAEWRRQQEQEKDQRSLEKIEKERSLYIEQELWKVSKHVKKHDSQYLVIAPTLSGRLLLVWSLVIAIAIGVIGVINNEASLLRFLNVELTGSLANINQFINPLLIVISVFWGLHSLLELTSNKTVMDKSTQCVVMQKPRFWFIPWRNDIPFSSVTSIVIDYELHSGERGGSYDVWKVSLNIGGEKNRKAVICAETKEEEMHNLALGISKFIGKELQISSSKPTPLSSEKVYDMDKLPTDWKL